MGYTGRSFLILPVIVPGVFVMLLSLLCLLMCFVVGADADPQLMRMIIPGFQVREIPIELTSLNNIEYDDRGRVFAGGYDGRFHLLTDTDGDGLEDHVDTFSPEKSPNYPLGITVREGVPYFVLTDEIIRFVDQDQDGVPEVRETVIKGFDHPELVKAPYLNHRRVDSSMAIAMDPEGAIYITMGNAGYSNPYWHDGVQPKGKIEGEPPGTPQYQTTHRRGCLLRITPDGQVTQLASGLRYVMSLQFNAKGDLFATDQEGATWCPNGNPFDELLHLEPGRHYGFPPRHPKYLNQVVDEPSVWDYAPQHQSTCGFRFNDSSAKRQRFGPEAWEGDAIVTGESRGKLWRTSLAKSQSGYVAMNQLIGTTSLLIVDCAISPRGELLVCCHTGKPDWGNGPNGAGKLFKIKAIDQPIPQPVAIWPRSETETVIAFDRPIGDSFGALSAKHVLIESGHYVAAADHDERIRPGYAVVGIQQTQIRTRVPVINVVSQSQRNELVVQTPPRRSAFTYAMTLPKGIDLAHDLSGVECEWHGVHKESLKSWLPHCDFEVARPFTRGSTSHDQLWQRFEERGHLTLRTQLDLWRMLVPLTQVGANLGYEPTPEVVYLKLQSDAQLKVNCSDAEVEQLDVRTVMMTVKQPKEQHWQKLEVALETPAKSLQVAYWTDRDPRPRALQTRRFLMPFAEPPPAILTEREIPELAGGDAEKGHALFLGKAACSSCHQLRGEGIRVGADLGNLPHRDYASVLRDVVDPNATISPDAIGYTVVLTDGKVVSGIRGDESSDILQLVLQGGKVESIKKTEIESIKPMEVSVMPAGIDKTLTAEELRDLMTYLLRP